MKETGKEQVKEPARMLTDTEVRNTVYDNYGQYINDEIAELAEQAKENVSADCEACEKETRDYACDDCYRQKFDSEFAFLARKYLEREELKKTESEQVKEPAREIENREITAEEFKKYYASIDTTPGENPYQICKCAEGERAPISSVGGSLMISSVCRHCSIERGNAVRG